MKKSNVFPATCAAEKLPEAKRYASPRADQPKGDGARVSLSDWRKQVFRQSLKTPSHEGVFVLNVLMPCVHGHQKAEHGTDGPIFMMLHGCALLSER